MTHKTTPPPKQPPPKQTGVKNRLQKREELGCPIFLGYVSNINFPSVFNLHKGKKKRGHAPPPPVGWDQNPFLGLMGDIPPQEKLVVPPPTRKPHPWGLKEKPPKQKPPEKPKGKNPPPHIPNGVVPLFFCNFLLFGKKKKKRPVPRSGIFPPFNQRKCFLVDPPESPQGGGVCKKKRLVGG